MNFTAPAFVLGFPLVLALHWALPPRGRWVLLLAASLAFYAVGSPQALGLLGCVTAGSYIAARLLACCRSAAAKRFWCFAAAALCLGCLARFKYAGMLGVGVGQALLPAGLSFYAFQTLGYVLDVYRGKLPPERHLGYYTLFVCFFPQLVAGPIERADALLPQLRGERRRCDANGWLLLLRGFAKKLLLADAMAPFVDRVYAAPGTAGGPALLLATVLFAGQIYLDFSGYSDIAVGTAALLGVRLSSNFDRPYAACSLRDFWRRWHITLNRFLTDALYLPLGGSRCGAGRHFFNLMAVFLVSGLWHGAAWHYLAWGAVHGLLLAAETALDRRGALRRLPRAARWVLTFGLVCAAWVFFRAPSTAAALGVFARLPTGWSLPALARLLPMLGQTTAARLLLGLACLRLLPSHKKALEAPAALLGVFALVLAVACAWFATLAGGASAFLYFQF